MPVNCDNVAVPLALSIARFIVSGFRPISSANCRAASETDLAAPASIRAWMCRLTASVTQLLFLLFGLLSRLLPDFVQSPPPTASLPQIPILRRRFQSWPWLDCKVLPCKAGAFFQALEILLLNLGILALSIFPFFLDPNNNYCISGTCGHLPSVDSIYSRIFCN